MKKGLRLSARTVILAVLLIIAIIFVIGYDSYVDERNLSKELEFQKETADLEAVKARLIREKKKVESDMISTLGAHATITLVAKKLDEALIEDLYEITSASKSGDEEKNMPVTMFISVDELPGMEGNISRQRFDDLVSFGWEYVLYWGGRTEDGQDDIEALNKYLSEAKQVLKSEGITCPSILAFRNMYYESKYDSVAFAHGFDSLVDHDDGSMVIETDSNVKIWHPGLIGWNTKGVAKSFVIKTVDGGALGLAFDVSYWGESSHYEIGDDEIVHNSYKEAAIRMIDFLTEYIESGKLIVCGYGRAREIADNFSDGLEQIRPLIDEKIGEYDLEISEIDRQIREVYKKYE